MEQSITDIFGTNGWGEHLLDVSAAADAAGPALDSPPRHPALGRPPFHPHPEQSLEDWRESRGYGLFGG